MIVDNIYQGGGRTERGKPSEDVDYWYGVW